MAGTGAMLALTTTTGTDTRTSAGYQQVDCDSDYSASSCCSYMMTKLKLNVYRAEDEFVIMQRLQWRKEEEESKKERRKVG